MKRKEYIKPAIETVEINGQAIMQASVVNIGVTTSDPIESDSDFGAKENTFDMWE